MTQETREMAALMKRLRKEIRKYRKTLDHVCEPCTRLHLGEPTIGRWTFNGANTNTSPEGKSVI